MASPNSTRNVASGVSKLNLKSADMTAAPTKPQKGTKQSVAESWEDEDMDSASDGDSRPSTSSHDRGTKDGTTAPPPTPISPNYSNASRPFPTVDLSTSLGVDQYDGAGSGPIKRPEKTDAVARRMIAGALGLKAPKLTDEQKAYEKAMKEKERKRREEERAAEKKREAEAEKAKAAIWED